MRAAAFARSLALALVQLVITPPYSLIALLTFPLPPLTRYRIITSWSRIVIRCAERICGVRYRVLGAENIPPTPCIILSKHESAWETLAFQVIFPPQVWVVKRELLWIPFFGWGLAMLSPIAIDRRSGARALKQTLDQGRERLAQGFSIVIFPEGSRSAPGVAGTYQVGGAWLAVHAHASVLPVAHNAGRCWPRNAFIKRAGTITVSIGPPMRAEGRQAPELMRDVERWIETEMQRIDAHEKLGA
ncbi:MAG: lysophospholipid acyltransferase family protein [Burkholderiales bacterium]